MWSYLCRRRQPDCPACPWRITANPHTLQVQSESHDRPQAPLPHKHIGVAVIWNNQQQVLIDQRKPEGLLGGLWEPRRQIGSWGNGGGLHPSGS
jgi:A/G-specific adenine glycosylase